MGDGARYFGFFYHSFQKNQTPSHLPFPRKEIQMNMKAWIITFVGLILGASIGYFYRPPALLIGQLPFDVVITRGGNLKGIEQIYLEAARTSFNYLLVGGIAGAIIGAIAGISITKKTK